MPYFKKLLDLLKIEREEDRNNYLKLTESTSIADRRANGLTWYPVAIRGSEPGRGDYLTVEVERPSHQDVAHQFRFGVPAALFSNHDPQKDRVEGTITYQSGNRLKITLFTEELPDWSRDGKLGVELLFDNNSYDEMQNALKQATASKEKPEGTLIRILTGEASPQFFSKITSPALPGLNQSQQAAVHQILSAQDLAIVHGPPGTGKTTTLVQAIKALVAQDKQQVLVVAPSNTAVDLLSEKLSNEGLNVLRIGNPARVSERLMSLTLDSKMAEHSYEKDVKKLKKQASEYKNMAHKYKRNFGKAERDQRKALFDEAHKIMREVDKTEQFITDDLVAKAQVIAATLIGANHYTVRDVKFNTVIIDEAGQALEPACWIPILKAQKLIMAGDHMQLPPTIKSNEAARGGLNATLLEKCAALYPEAVTLLDEQYRMNETIMGFSSKEFYDGRLKAHTSVANQLLFPGDLPFTFIDTAGCGFDEKLEGTSSVNPEEAAFLVKHLTQLADKLVGNTFPAVAVISPYKEQIRILQELVAESETLKSFGNKISVNTIDSFQGQERDVVYISMVRSNTGGDIGFLSDIRRMNVAITRAKKKLVMIGDSSTLCNFPFYADLIRYAEEAGGYKSAWEFI
ncbi:AAA domain-containing protein [Mucilaginibacter sp. L3T2-6]|uniref:AAA domain-containing protein n=1 Tax=Mucilaginibacter sp. L3T2-6 TaxID=3062491 RepID=UPI0026743E6F|nr:AAA domain-containing protein [Mucilaginibacter sp. L3T2-6]MDO3644331.1 AAA domain-containing protein [Mucilaginibacter sp. L3T2-6]MDV6216782.1 AAA domain-containing protein [Mucilaginibacter sp. L3T2-6]